MAGAAAGAAAAQAAAGLIGPIIQGGFSLAGIGLQGRLNKELAAIQNQYNIDMWRMNNEYNSPQAQMQRYQEAGLNPNLIYTQGNPGNSSSPAQMVAPQSVKVDKAMAELGKMFNLTNIMKSVQEFRNLKAEADAKEIANAEAKDQREAEDLLSWQYDFNPVTGLYEPKKPGENEVTVTRRTPWRLQALRDLTGAISTRGYKLNNLLVENYRRNKLISPRYNIMVPQAGMLNWEWQNQSRNYWIGTGLKAWQNLNNTIGNFTPGKWFVPRTSFNPYSSNRMFNPYSDY